MKSIMTVPIHFLSVHTVPAQPCESQVPRPIRASADRLRLVLDTAASVCRHSLRLEDRKYGWADLLGADQAQALGVPEESAGAAEWAREDQQPIFVDQVVVGQGGRDGLAADDDDVGR